MKKLTIKIGIIVFVVAFTTMAFTLPLPSVFPTEEKIELDGVDFQGDACYMENKRFQDGEEITYKLFYNWNFVWLPAGEVVFKVTEEGDQYHLSASGKTYSTYEWFFKVRDQYDTYIDKESLLPKTSIRDVHEGGYKLYDKLIFDQENKTTTSLRGDTKDKTVRREFEVNDCMHDILSIVYFARNIDFDNYYEGQETEVKIFMDKEVWPLSVIYRGNEANKKIKGQGRYNTIKFSPEVIAGDVFEEGTQMNIWVSDDGNRIPLLIESPVSVGSVKAVLKDYKGLRHQLSAKLK